MLIAATAGTPRHSLVLDHALRPLFSYSRAVVLPTGVFAATDDFGSGDIGGLESRIARAASGMATALVAESAGVEGFLPTEPARAPRRSCVDLGPVTDFASLLKGHDGS